MTQSFICREIEWLAMIWNEEKSMEASELKLERIAIWAANIVCVIIAFLLIFPLLVHFV